MIDVDINFGINMVEIVTKGLYTNAHDTLREYIQNSCDAIDDAIGAGTLKEGDDEIAITIDADNRRITIKDNGIGISSSPKGFVRIMSNFGNSDKSLKTDRGFRGIGRLGGLAYCKTLIFSTKVAGEKKISTLTINAEKIRQEFFSGNKRSAEEVLSKNMIFDTADIDTDEHFFKVEMIDIIDTNETLLDVKEVRNYLSFVAPVTYSPNLYYQTEIYKHAKDLGFKITEYKILVNNEPLTKPYKINVQTRMGKDEIFGLDFHDFKDDEGNLIAWSWVGLSNFKGVLDQTNGTPDNMMRGIRLRLGNIQIGDENIFQKLFKEPRGTTYFIGEVHAVDKKLRPTSRRDDFEEDKACNLFKEKLEEYFKKLHDLYHIASDIRSAYNAINAPEKATHEFRDNPVGYRKSHQAEHDIELARLKKLAATAEKKILSARQDAEQNPDNLLSRVVIRMTENQANNNPPPPVNLCRRLMNINNFRPFIGREKNENFTMPLKKSLLKIRSWRGGLSLTKLTRSLPNESPRLALGARLQKQISAAKSYETRNLFSECVQ